MTTNVVVVGSLNMDLVTRTPRFPEAGETILGGDFQTVPGGKGANQAVASARLGACVTMVGRVGRDIFAESLLSTLFQSGIDTRFVFQDEKAATGVAAILVDDTGQNSIVVAPGANMCLTPSDAEMAAESITAADALLLQLECPVETVLRAAQIAHQANVTVVLNPAPGQVLPADLLSLVDVLIPNESEISMMTGMPVRTIAECEAAARVLLESIPGIVIPTLGKQGAMLVQKDGTSHFPAFEVTSVDSTAAGDAFIAGFAVAVAEGMPLAEAVRWGNATGALATTLLGAQTSLPNLEAVQKLAATEISV